MNSLTRDACFLHSKFLVKSIYAALASGFIVGHQGQSEVVESAAQSTF